MYDTAAGTRRAHYNMYDTAAGTTSYMLLSDDRHTHVHAGESPIISFDSRRVQSMKASSQTHVIQYSQ